MQPLDNLIEKDDKSIKFIFEFEERPNSKDLRPLWLPGGPIFQGLVDYGYVSNVVQF